MSRLWVLLYSWGFKKWSKWSDHVDHFNVTFNLYNLSCIFIIFISCMKVTESEKFSGLMKFLASFVTVAIFCVVLVFCFFDSYCSFLHVSNGFLSLWPFVFLFWIFFSAPFLKLKLLLFYDSNMLYIGTVFMYGTFNKLGQEVSSSLCLLDAVPLHDLAVPVDADVPSPPWLGLSVQDGRVGDVVVLKHTLLKLTLRCKVFL